MDVIFPRNFTVVSEEHPSNALFPTAVTVAGSVTLCRFVQSENMPSIDVRPDSIVISVMPEPENAFAPMLSGFFGRVRAVRALHPLNADSPIDLTESGREISFSMVLLPNADLPTDTAPSVTVILVRQVL